MRGWRRAFPRLALRRIFALAGIRIVNFWSRLSSPKEEATMSATESEAEIIERVQRAKEASSAASLSREDRPLMALAITGGRSYTPSEQDMACFWRLVGQLQPAELHHGGCQGVDLFVASQVRRHRPEIRVVAHRADWNRWGKAAGPRRNREMMAVTSALVAFPGGRGTRSCEEEARHLGCPVYRIQAAAMTLATAHEHEVPAWIWSPARAVWTGRCAECSAEVIADRVTAAKIEHSIP